MSAIVEWLSQHNISFLAIVMTATFMIAAAITIRLLRQWLTYLQVRFHLTDETTFLIARVMTGGLWLIAIAVILNVWGVSLGGLWTVLVSTVTIIGVGFLATWTMISNFTASLFLTLWRPFHLGQTVEMLPEKLGGRVTERNLMFTTLREESGSVLQIPNNLFFQKLFRVSGEPAAAWLERPKEVRAPSLVQT
jgi:small-conductance mechanosensitive channel